MTDRDAIMGALSTVIDPELGIDIVNLGLVYTVDWYAETGKVLVEMTMTTPNCPLTDIITGASDKVIRELDGVNEVVITVVWQPPWDANKISALGRRRLGM